MNADKVNQPLREYLDSMQTLPPVSPDILANVTLSALREMAHARTGKKITQLGLANVLDRGESTIQQWEYGTGLKGIKATELVTMANLFGCRIEEVIAAIENTDKKNKN